MFDTPIMKKLMK